VLFSLSHSDSYVCHELLQGPCTGSTSENGANAHALPDLRNLHPRLRYGKSRQYAFAHLACPMGVGAAHRRHVIKTSLTHTLSPPLAAWAAAVPYYPWLQDLCQAKRPGKGSHDDRDAAGHEQSAWPSRTTHRLQRTSMEIRHGGAPGGWLPPIVPRELRAAGSDQHRGRRSLAGSALSGHPFAGCSLDAPTRKSAPCGILRTCGAANEPWHCDGSVNHGVIK
jgi:hypothetical protein